MRKITNIDDLSTTKFSVVKFEANWCGPCKMYTPTFETASAKFASDDIQFVAVDVDEAPDIARRFAVRGVPTTVICDQNGQDIWRAVGVTDFDTLSQAVAGLTGNQDANI